MNRLLRILSVIFMLSSISAFANSINFSNLSVNFGIDPNEGFGDNIGGQIFGPGVNLFVLGGTMTGWFDDGDAYAPGSTWGGPVFIGFDFASGKVGSLTYNYDSSVIFGTTLYTGYFTFPTNGQNFTVTMPAFLDQLSGVICPNNGCTSFNLNTMSGTLTLSFYYAPGSQAYYADYGSFTTSGPSTTTPETSTFLLMGIGMGAVTWCRFKQKNAAPRLL